MGPRKRGKNDMKSFPLQSLLIVTAHYVMKVVMVTGGVKVTDLKGKWKRTLIIYTFGKASL